MNTDKIVSESGPGTGTPAPPPPGRSRSSTCRRVSWSGTWTTARFASAAGRDRCSTARSCAARCSTRCASSTRAIRCATPSCSSSRSGACSPHASSSRRSPGTARRHPPSSWRCRAWLWFTVLFANFAEAMAEGRGKAQADSLRKARKDIQAKQLAGASTGRRAEPGDGIAAPQGQPRDLRSRRLDPRGR